MKTLKTIFSLSLFVLIFSNNLFCQSDIPVDEDTGLITYQEVVEQDGSPSILQERAIDWINDFYKNPDNVIRTNEDNKITGLHRFKINNTDEDGNQTKAGVIQYDFSIELKDGRYRFTLTEFVLKQASKIPVEKWLNKDDPNYNPVWESYLLQINEFVKSWIDSLKQGMLPKVEKSDDW